jgi:regulator of replication initiation timing
MNMLSARDPDDDGVQVLERVEFSDDEDEDFKYEEVLEDGPEDDEDNDLADALASLQLKNNNTSTGKGGASMSGSQFLLHQSNTITQVRPSVVDDFVRNFLIKAGMKRSLEVFNTEWYELQSKGRIPSELSSAVPDIYLRNEELDLQARNLREQVDKMREVASRAQATWDKFRKERDFHRMHHKRVVQEKNKLITDLKRLRNHLRSYEPTIDEQKRRYELAMKEKMLIRLERDRLKARVKALEEQVAQLQQPPQLKPSNSSSNRDSTAPHQPVHERLLEQGEQRRLKQQYLQEKADEEARLNAVPRIVSTHTIASSNYGGPSSYSSQYGSQPQQQQPVQERLYSIARQQQQQQRQFDDGGVGNYDNAGPVYHDPNTGQRLFQVPRELLRFYCWLLYI